MRRERAEVVRGRAESIGNSAPPVTRSAAAYRLLYAERNRREGRDILDGLRKAYALSPSAVNAGRVAEGCLDLAALLDAGQRDELLTEALGLYETWKGKGGLIPEEEALIDILRGLKSTPGDR